MKKVFITLIFFSVLTLFFPYTRTYWWKEVFQLNYGEGQYDLGIIHNKHDKYFSACAFAFDKNNYFYIGDVYKDRILVYDNQFQFVKEIKCTEPGMISKIRRILVDDDLNIICLRYNYFFKIDQEGNLIYPPKENVLPKDYYNQENAVMYENYLTGMLFPDEGDKLVVIGEDGERLTADEVEQLQDDSLNGLDLFTDEEKANMIFENGYTIDYNEIKSKLKSINALIDNKGRIYTPDKKCHKELAEIRRNIANKTKLLTDQDIIDEPLPYRIPSNRPDVAKREQYYVGIDSKQNTYWSNRYDRITWYDKYGKFDGIFISISHFARENDMLYFALMGNDDHIYFVCLDHEKGMRLYNYEEVDWESKEYKEIKRNLRMSTSELGN